MALDQKNKNSSGQDRQHAHRIDFGGLLKLGSDAVLVVSLDGSMLFASPPAEMLFGWPLDLLEGHLGDLVQVETADRDASALHRILSGNGDPDGHLPDAELLLRSATGSPVWVHAAGHALNSADGKVFAFALFFKDIARLRELEGLLEAAAQTDSLTGLFNRNAFEETLKREWALALREKTHTSLIKVTLDRFEALVEGNGSHAAEDCLVKVAQTLKETARRPADIAARTATSEFSLLLPRTHGMGAETISAYIQVAIEDLAIPNAEGDGVVTASVGAVCTVAEQNGISESHEFILSAAENCVFEARQEGGNRVKTLMKTLTR
ncbi:MAG: PAS domain-containing protein [Pseudomonadota bacterium]